jgi:hypothetical protein
MQEKISLRVVIIVCNKIYMKTFFIYITTRKETLHDALKIILSDKIL